ncbi:MAG: pyridoxamine 5'-phosphate oxidase family protein, partial [Pseudomonadota bacterium]|nr:pyridoxamine 5'-phosphate oxidase family protein [Pseudomonadota bacterium]
MNRDLHSLRRDYQFDDLTEEKAGQDPLALFDKWLNLAIESCPEDPTGMLLSTVDADNKPHCRTVLLKQREGDAFSFYTNYDSDKGQDIAQNPNVCLTFFWP